jgi:hypothetical protein
MVGGETQDSPGVFSRAADFDRIKQPKNTQEQAISA